ncbi:MAG: hypothetical protein EHM45_18000 [Desulfobacteraceae bacterium]|nr:MAG: hypothetical protein EHM45_18000 [Desulfobacteraceae bacterium]
MKTNKKIPVLLLITAFLMVFILSETSYAGRVGRNVRVAKGGPVDAQLGVRFVSQLPENLKPGDSMEAIVLNPAKLKAHGFAGLKRGDRITFIQGQEADVFQIQQGTKQRLFKIKANGAVAGL